MLPTTPVIRPLSHDDQEAWNALACGYKEFYKTSVSAAQYEATWQRLIRQDGVFGLGAEVDGKLVGLAHYLFHTSPWSMTVCYLEDLFVAPEARGHGVAKALIEAVARVARESGASRFYWSTHESNRTARALYDKVAKHVGFIRYDFPLANVG